MRHTRTNRNARGAMTLSEAGRPALIRLPDELRDQAERWGRDHAFPSLAAVVRYALRELVEEHHC